MNFEGLIQEAFNIAGTFNLKLVIFLFLICSIGEFGLFSIPYLLETIWLLSGYNVSSGVLAPYHMILLWLVAQVGRQVGATVLYHLGQFGSVPLRKLYRKYFETNSSRWLSGGSTRTLKFINEINYLSPFFIASGRLFGLRVPLTLTLGVKKQFKALSLGILLSSLAWDGIYILLGLAGGHTALKPAQMILYSLIGLTIFYTGTLAIRLFKRRLSRTT